MSENPQEDAPDEYPAAIIASSEDTIISKTLDGIVTSWNAAAERHYGYRADEIVGHSILRLVPEDRVDEEHRILAAVRRGERVEHYQTVRRRKDGRAVEVSLTVSPVRDASGQVTGASTIARDMTVEQRAARTDAYLAAVVASCDDAIVTKTLNGMVTTWNRGAEILFGYTASEMLGQSIRTLIPKDRQAEEDRILAAIRSGERVDHYETVRLRKDGSPIDISITVSPLIADGTIIGASKVARNISRQQETARANAYLAAIVTSSDDAIVSKTLEGIVTSWNQAAERVFGYAAGEMIGQPILRLIPPDRRHEEEYILTSIRRGERVEHYETVRRRKDGHLIPVSITVSPVKDESGQIIGASKIARDLSHLERLVSQRTRELEQSRDQLRRLSTELNLAEQRERKKLAGELHDHLQQLLVLTKLKLAQSKRVSVDNPACLTVLNATDEVLATALQYTRGLVMELSPPVLREHGLAASLKWLGEYMRKHDMEISVTVPEEELTLPEDQAVLLFQSVRELLMNARKHSGTNAACVQMEWQAEGLKIEVSDEGRGFDPTTASSTSDITPLSTKFGLLSIRERMTAIGGDLMIQSAPVLGTTAVLRLPLSQVPFPEPRPELIVKPAVAGPRRPLGTGKITVLLVDDHVMLRQGLRNILEAYPDLTLVAEAGDGETAIKLAREHQPAVIIMDMNMPGIDGIEATSRIVAEFPQMAVIGLSVNGGDPNNQRAMQQAGARCLLTKDAAAEVLYEAILQSFGFPSPHP